MSYINKRYKQKVTSDPPFLLGKQDILKGGKM
jgi:hypothetical protein